MPPTARLTTLSLLALVACGPKGGDVANGDTDTDSDVPSADTDSDVPSGDTDSDVPSGDTDTVTTCPDMDPPVDTDVGLDTGPASPLNSPPVLMVVISPKPARSNTSLLACASAFDAEGDPVTIYYHWSLQRPGSLTWTPIVSASTATLSTGAFAQGDHVRIDVFGDDGFGLSDVASDSVLIEN